MRTTTRERIKRKIVLEEKGRRLARLNRFLYERYEKRLSLLWELLKGC